GGMEFPLVVRMPYGGGVRAPELHDDSPEAYYVHTPGVKVAIPSTPADAKGLLAAAIRDPDPVVVLEPKLHYRTMRGEVPTGEHLVPLGEARVAREGDDVTIVAYGAMVPVAEAAADALEAEASVEVLDIRTLKPLDEDALLASVGKTGRACGSRAPVPATGCAMPPRASRCAGRTRVCVSSLPLASHSAPATSRTCRSIPGVGSRSWPSRTTSTIRTQLRSGTKSGRCRRATCRARSRRSSTETSRRSRSGASKGACAC